MRTGEIIKSASTVPEEDELELINKYTRRPFSRDEVYVFSVVLCDNDVDRDYERFTVEALFQMEKLFVGKTGICDHNPKAENQTARIFRCYVEAQEGRKTLTGDDYFRLVARAYMPVCRSTEDIITQIESGIRKEVSVGCSAQGVMCSVCGSDRITDHCGHIKGEYYGGELCYAELSDINDAYEWSFVAVPAQREAGVIKNFTSQDNKEYSDMNEIIKALTVGESVTLSVEDSKRLAEHITSLERKAMQVDEYRDELTQEVLRLSAVAQPAISRGAMENALKSLTVAELREFMRAYRQKAEASLLPRPQTAPAKSQDTARGNKEYRI